MAELTDGVGFPELGVDSLLILIIPSRLEQEL
jgi:hypothetical protein